MKKTTEKSGPPKSHPTLTEIARVSGVSKASVSLALNDRPGVSELTRVRVKEVARKLGYHGNPLVSSMMNQIRKGRQKDSSPTIGFVILRPRNTWPFLEEVKAPIHSQGISLGYQVRDFYVGEGGLTPENLAGKLRSEGVEGVIVGDAIGSRRVLPIHLEGFSKVMMGNSVERPALDRVCAHKALNIRTAIAGLRSLGYKKIALVVDPVEESRSDYTYCASFSNSTDTSAPGIPRLEPWVFESRDDFAKFERWFRENKPDGIISPHLFVQEWLKTMKVAVPEEVGVAHTGIWPGKDWSGINQNFPFMAESALELLDTQFRLNRRKLPSYPKVVLIPGHWVAGKTASRRT